MIGEAQNASDVVHGFEREEEMLIISQMGNVIANLHTTVVVGARSFASESVESRVPICLVIEESTQSVVISRRTDKCLQQLSTTRE